MNILLPTDFSENSRNAIIYALNLYKNQVCNFYFLHAFPRTIYSYESQVKTGTFGGDLVTKETQKKVALLDDFIADLQECFNTKKQNIYSIVTRDFTTDAIKDTAREKEIDLIVVGAKGETDSSSVIFGSVTSYVLTKIKTSTLTIPSSYKFTSVKNILFPSDYLVEHNSSVVQSLINITKIANSKITLLHCSTNELSEKQTKNIEKLSNLLTELKPTKEFIKNDDFVTEVEQKMNEFDMLFMINNKKSFFENLFFTPTVSKVVVSIKKPFLVSHF